MILPVPSIATPGLLKDLPTHRLPLGAWSEVRNARFMDGYATSGFAKRSVLTPAAQPLFLGSARGDTLLWVLATAGKVYAFTEGSSSDITRVSGDYTGGEFDFWNGSMFNGFYLLNNGVDIPQEWNGISTTTPLVDLPDWPSDVRAKVIRPFGAFLVALDVTKSSVRDQRLVKWSHSADPNTLPSSWDETDATKDAGEKSLAEGKDALMDCLPLYNANVIYSELQTWRMDFIGSPLMFSFNRIFPSSGILAQGCVQPFKGSHFVVSQDDILVHNLNSVQSVADAATRRWFFSHLDGNNYLMTRVVRLVNEREMWICFAEEGSVLTHALVWNWFYNTWTVHDLPMVKCVTDSYAAPAATPDPWTLSDDTWDSDTEPWGGGYGSFKYTEAILMGNATAIYHLGEDNTDTVDVTLERTGLIHVGPEEADELNYKSIISVRPSISAPAGTVITISVGSQEMIDGDVTWTDSQPFVVGTDVELALNTVGRYLAIKFEWSTAAKPKFYGFYMDVVRLQEAL